MSKVTNVYPDWVEKYRDKGVTIRKKGNGYGLYKCTSIYVKSAKYPKTVQEYLGMVYEDRGFVPKTLKSDKPIYFEYGLSKFIMINFKRELLKAAYDKNEDIVKLGILMFIFDSYDEIFIKNSFLTCEDKDLIEYALKVSDKRIKTIKKKITSTFEERIPDQNDRNKLVGLLRLCVKDSYTLKEPVINDEICSICERYGLSLWQ